MQRRLSVEKHEVPVLQVPLHYVPDFEVHVRPVAQNAQVDLPLVVADDVLGAGPLTRTIFNQESELVDVLGGHSLRHCEAHRDDDGNSKLVEIQIRIGRDHCPSREVNSLAHQVSSEPAFFALEARTHTLYDFAGLVLLNGLTRDLVVHEGRHKVLETGAQFVDDSLVRALLSLLFQDEVHLDDLLKGVREVILAAHCTAHGD